MSELLYFTIDLGPSLVAEGHYRIDGEVLSVTNSDGRVYALEDGSLLQHALKPGDKPEAIAKYLLRKAEQPSAFNRPLKYPVA